MAENPLAAVDTDDLRKVLEVAENVLIERAREVVDLADDHVELGMAAEELGIASVGYLGLLAERARREEHAS